jgi:hypothetical protein
MIPSKVSENGFKPFLVSVQNQKYTFLTVATLTSEEVTYIGQGELL